MGDAAGAVASGDAVVVNCFSSELSIFWLPYIYSMFVAARARCDLWSTGLAAPEATVLSTFCLIRLTRLAVARRNDAGDFYSPFSA
jgi:hypothetical protein